MVSTKNRRRDDEAGRRSGRVMARGETACSDEMLSKSPSFGQLLCAREQLSYEAPHRAQLIRATLPVRTHDISLESTYLTYISHLVKMSLCPLRIVRFVMLENSEAECFAVFSDLTRII